MSSLRHVWMSPRSASAVMAAAAIVCVASGVLADVGDAATDRQKVTSIRPLLIAAIDHGSSSGEMEGAQMDMIRNLFRTQKPLLIDVRVVEHLKEQGCKRLEVTSLQREALPTKDVVHLMSKADLEATKNGTVAHDVKFTYRINYCRDGRFPRTVTPPIPKG